MSFAHPEFLWALLLGLIPILIYYLLRFRALRVNWGANYVLERALERLQKTWNIEHLILMSLRVLACLLIVLAFARPRGEAGSGGGPESHHVVFLDGSYSMRATDGEASRWEKAIAALKRLAKTWDRGDTWSLCVLDGEPRWPVENAAISDGSDAAAALDALEPAEASASLASALAELRDRLPRGSAEIVVVADNQASTWEGVDQTALPPELDAKLFWLNPLPELRENIAVTRVEPAARRALAGHAVPVYVGVRSFAPERVEDLQLELLVDGTFDSRRTISLLPGQERTLRMRAVLEEPGAHRIAVRLARDELPFDDQHVAGIDVSEKLQVTVLREEKRSGKFDSAWSFLEVVQNAEKVAAESAASAPAGSVAWRLGTGDPANAGLAESDVVLLDSGRPVTPELARALEAYVDGGGGLLLAPGPRTPRKRWNDRLGGRDLLAARLGPMRNRPIDGDDHLALAPQTLAPSMLGAFRDSGLDLGEARFYRWFAPGSTSGDARVLARFDDHKPWALERGGRIGRVVQTMSGLNGRGNNLIVREFFLPLIYRLAQQAAAGGIHPRTLARGEAARLRLESPEDVEAVTFGPLTAQPEPVETESRDGAALAQVERELASGAYQMLVVRERQNRRVYFGVQGERVDSDLAPVSAAHKKAFKEGLDLREATSWKKLESLRAQGQLGREWQHWVLIAALIVLIGEMVFQRRFAPVPRGRRGGATTGVRGG